MLNDVQFVESSLTLNLFYLRTIREFCTNIQLSFFHNERQYIETAEDFAKTCEELGNILMQYANGNIPQKAIDDQIFVTRFTLPSELLTEKLFNINIDTNITEQQLRLTGGVPTNITPILLNALTTVNNRALVLAENFITFCQEILSKIQANETFSYSYPLIYTYMIEEVILYQNALSRVNRRISGDPTSATDFEYWFNESMKNAALFIRGLVNPSDNTIFIASQEFVIEFNQLLDDYKNTALTPENQKALTARSLDTLTRFRTFLQGIISLVLNAKLHFVVEPIFLDNLYTEANYFNYILTSNQQQEVNY